MTVEELRVFINAIANKDQSGNSMSPSEYNSYLQRANEDKFRVEYGLRERGPNNPVFFQNHQSSTDAMRKFITTATVPVATSQAVLPGDYVHFISASITTNNKPAPVTVINRDEMAQTLSDPISYPIEKYPYGTIEQGILYLYPDTITSVQLTYLRRPAAPVWGFTIVNDDPVYDSATSVQLEWDPVYHIDIARIILGYLGINFRDADLLTYAEQIKAAGA